MKKMKMKTHVLALGYSGGWVFRIRCWAILPCWTCERIWIPWTFKWCCGSLSGRDQCHQPLVSLNKNTNRVRHMVKRSHFMAPTCVRLKSFWVSCVHPLEAIIEPHSQRCVWCQNISYWPRRRQFEASRGAGRTCLRWPKLLQLNGWSDLIRCSFRKLNWKGRLFG